MKTALTIAGSDSCGSTGIQADLKTFSVLGVYGMSAITAVTAQNTLGIKRLVELEASFIRLQIDTVASDIQVDACKSGLLPTAEAVGVAAEAIRENKLSPYVCDPVMFMRNGELLIKEDAIEAMKKRLFPLATLISPNRREAARLAGIGVESLTTVAAAKDASRRILSMGVKAVLIKGIATGNQMIDLYFDGKEFLEFASELLPKEKTHGSGSAFSAAITAGLANRLDPVAAIDQAKQLISMAIQYSDGQGRGTAPVNVLAFAPKKK